MEEGYNIWGKFLKAEDQYVPRFKDVVMRQRNDGLLVVDWECDAINADSNGFDVTETRYNGKYTREIYLPRGFRIIRFGDPNGKFSAPYGTAYDELSLPYTIESMTYHEYVVKRRCFVKMYRVQEGIVARNFKCRGGGTQYHHRTTIAHLLQESILEEDISWLRNVK